MPLLDDSKSVYVGTTPITKVMAGDVQVWPKGTPDPDPPEFSQVGMRFPIHRSYVNYPVSWDVEEGSCDDLKTYEVRYGWSSDYPDGDGSTPPTTWQPWRDLWTQDLTVFDPTNKKIYWANVYAETDYNGLGQWTWAEVRETVSHKTVVPPVQTAVEAAEIPYPVGGIQCSTVYHPGQYPPSQHVAWYHFDDDLKSDGGLAPALTSKGVLGYEFLDSPWEKCVSPSGSSGDVMFLESKISAAARPYTIEGWFKIPSLTFSYGTSSFIGFESYESTDDTNADLNSLAFYIMSGKVKARSGFIPKGTTNTNEIIVNFSDAGVEANQWFHVAASCSQDGTSLNMYVNGHYKGTDTNGGFDPRYPMQWIKVQTRSQYNREKIQIDEVRLSKEIVYPDSDSTP